MSGTEDRESGALDLGREGVIWLDGAPVAVELTGSSRAVAKLSMPEEPSVWPSRAAVPLEIGSASRGTSPPGFFDIAEPSMVTLGVGGASRRERLAAIDRWYRREARERIGNVVEVEADRLSLHPKKLTIRDQKTRWGSCSTSGTLSFNWRLVIGPGHALRYVVIHELIHIRHHNHSRAFWAALSEALPDWKRSATWLRANEKLLTAYRPRL